MRNYILELLVGKRFQYRTLLSETAFGGPVGYLLVNLPLAKEEILLVSIWKLPKDSGIKSGHNQHILKDKTNEIFLD
jgi:hypothetical protein